MEWTPLLKLALVMAVIFLVIVLGFLMVTMKSVGGMGHNLDRFEELISKEVIATYKRKLVLIKKEKHRQVSENDRARRQSALLNVPLMNTRKPEANKDS